jgi:membrane fusion protein, multidrug efflux system
MTQIARSPNPLAAWTRRALLVLAASTLVAVLSACGRGGNPADAATAGGETSAAAAKKPEVQAIPVEVEPVRRRSIAASYSGTASLEAPHEAQVVAKTSGVLLKLEAEEGDRVRRGQVLARIDPERARLEVQRAEATLRKLEAEFARSKELFERKLVAADAHERLRFDVETQRAVHELAKLELSYTAIVAPIDGVIARRMVKEGNLLPLNAPAFRIVNTDHLEAVLNVPERELGTMQSGLAVTMLVDALGGRQVSGRIDRVSPVVDPGTGTFRVTAAFYGGQVLRPGMFGRLVVVYDQRADVLTVPRAALLEGEGEAAVFAVREGKAVRTGVRLGHVNGTYAEVTGGVAEGDQVVTVGKVTLRDGAMVEIVNAPVATPADAARIAHASAGTVASE